MLGCFNFIRSFFIFSTNSNFYSKVPSWHQFSTLMNCKITPSEIPLSDLLILILCRTDSLKIHLQYYGLEGILELKKISERFEEGVYTAATSEVRCSLLLYIPCIYYPFFLFLKEMTILIIRLCK